MQTDTYLTDNARYDPYLWKQLSTTTPKHHLIDMTDTILNSLLKGLGYKPKEK